MGLHYRKYSQIIEKKRRGGGGAKGSKGIFWEIMGPSETKYSQINKEKQKKDAKSTRGFFGKMSPSQHIMKEKIQGHHI
jgi:hypothetical protein